MAREMVGLLGGRGKGNVDEHDLISLGGITSLLSMALLLLSVVSFLIFSCADKKKRGDGGGGCGFTGGGGCGCDGGCGCGGGGGCGGGD